LGECSPLPVGPAPAPPATSTAPPRSRRPPEPCRMREPDLSWALRSRRGQVSGGVEKGQAEPDEPGSCGRALGPDAVATLDSPLVTTTEPNRWTEDRKSTRLNSSHVSNSYAVLCLKQNTGVLLDHLRQRTARPQLPPD